MHFGIASHRHASRPRRVGVAARPGGVGLAGGHGLRGLLGVLCVLLLLLASAAPAAAQRVQRPLRVFLDCTNFRCDSDYFTQEIPWVDFVRDRLDSDIHVLGTRQQTGAGGSAYTFELRGRGAFEGERITTSTATPADATDADRRRELVAVVRMALAPFARWTPAAPVVEVRPPEAGVGPVPAGADPWNRWTFRVGLNGRMNGESRQSYLRGSGSASANRVTEQWKTLFSVRGSVDRSDYLLADSTTFVSRQESYSAGAVVVRSVGAHWGVGGVAEWVRSSFGNYDASVIAGPAVEYNVFPYAESTRRILTVLYAIGPRYNDYEQPTIFDATTEALAQQILVATYEVTQPWGSIDVSLQGDHYITTFGNGRPWADAQFSARFSGGLEVRLLRGLSAELNGSVATVRNQIQLAAGELTEEEILTRQRELATNYRYFMSLGVSYRFGSIFSDVVNPRFDAFD